MIKKKWKRIVKKKRNEMKDKDRITDQEGKRGNDRDTCR